MQTTVLYSTEGWAVQRAPCNSMESVPEGGAVMLPCSPTHIVQRGRIARACRDISWLQAFSGLGHPCRDKMRITSHPPAISLRAKPASPSTHGAVHEVLEMGRMLPANDFKKVRQVRAVRLLWTNGPLAKRTALAFMACKL